MVSTVLITGANRGLGLEFVKQYTKENFIIHACCRNPNQAEELRALQQSHSNIIINQLDICLPSDIAFLQERITDPIDILINNAGILEKEPEFPKLSIDIMTKSFLTNAVGAIKVTEAFLPHLAKSQHRLVVSITSKMGSISDNLSGGYYSYRAGKAALNMMMKSAAVDMKEQKIGVLLLHPGWVKTRMGGENALLKPEESVSAMREVIHNFTPTLGEAQFYSYDGEKVLW